MIRTYQEILLATNPVVVCGDQHATWINFVRNVLLLETAMNSIPLSITRPWIRSAMHRNKVHRSTTLNPNNDASELAQYVEFVRKILKTHRRLCGLLRSIFAFFWVVGLFMTPIALVFGDVESGIIRAVYGLWYASISSCLVSLIFVIRTLTLNYNVTWRSRPIVGDIPHELYARTAKEDKDMAYGMWAVLQRQGATGLPRPDYSSSTAELYRIFTLNLIKTTQSLTPLLLAAVKNVTGPSWVPDWNTP
jgi:hypothetical protein